MNRPVPTNRQIRLALSMMILLLGVGLLASCSRTAQPEPPSPQEQDSVTEEAYRARELAAQKRGRAEQSVRASGLSMAPAFIAGSQQAMHVSPDWDPESLASGSESFEAEIWVIAKASPVPSLDEGDPDPGSGALVANIPSEDEADGTGQVALPLQHTAVDASIAGHISTVRVKQQFANPFDTKIEAVYVFPLPEKAAVTEFLMIIGERTIRGILREKEEAEAIYRAARDQGYQASLLVQQRPNIFEQKVANIEPGKAIDVDITYLNTLAYRDGRYSFVFPAVVGPRFNPPGLPGPCPRTPARRPHENTGRDRAGIPGPGGTVGP